MGSKSGHLETSLHASLPSVCLHHFETGIVNGTTKLPSSWLESSVKTCNWLHIVILSTYHKTCSCFMQPSLGPWGDTEICDYYSFSVLNIVFHKLGMSMVSAGFAKLQKLLLYLPMYTSILCICWPPILEPKNEVFLFLGKNFHQKLSFILEFSFRYAMVTQKICPEFFIYLSFWPMYKSRAIFWTDF